MNFSWRRGLASVCGLACLIPALSFADNTESLGTPSIPFAMGTEVIAAGTGLDAQPGVIEVDVDAPIRQVVVYWSGAMGSNVLGDDTIEIDGVEITGTPVGGPAFFFNCGDCGDNTGPFYYSSFRADITEFGLVTLGANTLEVVTEFDRENSGAGIVVITDNGTRSGTVIGRDGMDLAFEDFPSPRNNTVPQNFHFGPSLADRAGTVTLMVGGVGDQPNLGSIIRLTVDGVSTDHVNVLGSVDGNFWDTITLPVDVPAGASMITAQLLSTGGDRPAGLSWVSATMFVPSATETLATADIPVFSGSGVAAAGTGLFEQPGTIDLDVPAGAIQQVLVYWSGAEVGAPILGDDTILLNGVEVQGEVIGDPAFFFDCVGCGENSGPFFYSSFRADITDLGLVTAGANSIQANTDFGTDNSGASIVVIYDDGSEDRALLLKDGLDLAFGGFDGLRSRTEPQTFHFAPSDAERSADLLLVVGSVSDGGGTNTVDITIDGVEVSLPGLLTAGDGRLWDTVTLPVTVGAGVDQVTVELTSGGPNPQPLSWVAAGLSLPVESDGLVDALQSTAFADPEVVSAFGGTSVITAVVVDGSGTPLPGLDVLFTTFGGSLEGVVTDHGDGSYSQSLIADPSSTFGEVTIIADGVVLAEKPLVTFLRVDPELSTIQVTPEEVFLGGIAVVTVIPKDANGVELGVGEVVELTTDLGQLVGDVVDNGDGSYSQMLQANGLGTASISAVAAGIELANTGTLTVLEMTEVGNVIGVAPNGDTHAFCTIQQAINASDDIPLVQIVVLPGDYPERLRVRNRENLTIEGLSTDGPVTVRGVRVRCSEDIQLRNLDVESCRTSVKLVWSSDVELNGCRLSSWASRGRGIYAVACDDVLVANCEITDHRYGIRTRWVDDFVVQGSVISDCTRNAIRTRHCDRITIQGNLLENSGRHAIHRQRGWSGNHPHMITLKHNDFDGNCGRVRPGKSDQNLNSFARILDDTDEQTEYEEEDE